MNNQKAEYIQQRYIKDRLEEMNKDEIEFYAEQYLGDLEIQHKDAEREQPKDFVMLAIETAQRIKPFVIDVEDLDNELIKLKKIREIVVGFDTSYYTPEIIRNILNMIDNRIEDIKTDCQTEVFEICQITEDVGKRFK